MTTPTVSVALCTHNGARFVQEQLRSILSQTVLPTQIVISDDASSDETLAIVRAVLAGVSGIHVDIMHNPIALGVVANFQQAVTACTGDLVALCDQDDVWHPDRLAVAATRFEASEALTLVHSDARLVDEVGAPLGHSLFMALGISAREREEAASGDELAVLLRRNLVTGATAMFSRRAVSAAVPFAELWVHDEWLAMIAASIGEGELLDVQLVDYRQHSGNQIGVQRLSLTGKLGRVLEPRNGRNVYLANRAALVLERLEALGAEVRPDALARVREKLEHLTVRAGYSRNRLGRIGPVARELRTGRYARYSRGLGDVLRDLLQPAGDESDAGRRIVAGNG